MKKKLFVLFHDGRATLFNNVAPQKLSRDDVIIENPDLQFVNGISPYFWKLVDGRIFPMNEQERKPVLKNHPKPAQINKNNKIKKLFILIGKELLAFAMGAITIYLLMRRGS